MERVFDRLSEYQPTMSQLRDAAAVSGIGETRYLRGTNKTPLRLTLEASLAAIDDAGLTPIAIDGIVAYASGGVVAEDRDRSAQRHIRIISECPFMVGCVRPSWAAWASNPSQALIPLV